MRKPRFNRKTDAWVCIRPVRISTDTFLAPGDPVEGLRMHHLRLLFQRNRIGPADSEWTQEMLQLMKNKEMWSQQTVMAPGVLAASGFTAVEFSELQDEMKALLDMVYVQPPLDLQDKVPVIPNTALVGDVQLTASVPLGGGWYEVTVNGETQKVHGKEAADALIAESAKS